MRIEIVNRKTSKQINKLNLFLHKVWLLISLYKRKYIFTESWFFTLISPLYSHGNWSW
jgi:hypothetical protein